MLFNTTRKPEHLKAKDSIWRNVSQKQDLGQTSKLHIWKRTGITLRPSLDPSRSYHHLQAHRHFWEGNEIYQLQQTTFPQLVLIKLIWWQWLTANRAFSNHFANIFASTSPSVLTRNTGYSLGCYSAVLSEAQHLRVVYPLPFNTIWYSHCLHVTACGEKMQNLKIRYQTNSTEKITPENAAGWLARIPLPLGHTYAIWNLLMTMWILNRFWSCKKKNSL